MIYNKKRILIIGNSGSGKSTFARFLGEKLDKDVYHLDRFFWKPGWERTEPDEWKRIVKELISKDEWIIDGNYSGTLRERALRSDLIFFFDYSSAFCLYRIFKRIFKSKMKLEDRSDMSDGCLERWFDREFVDFVRTFNEKIRPRVFSILEEISFNKNNLVIFKNRKEFDQYIYGFSKVNFSDHDLYSINKKEKK